MTIRQVSMPTSIKTNSIEAQFIQAGHKEASERHHARIKTMQEDCEAAEREMDELLSDNFRLITQYDIDSTQGTATVFVFWKHEPDFDKFGEPDEPAFKRGG